MGRGDRAARRDRRVVRHPYRGGIATGCVIVDRLAELGPAARMPFSRSLGEGLFELRFALGPTARRITYRFTKDARIVLLTTFRKQRDNERAQIARARQAAQTCAVDYP